MKTKVSPSIFNHVKTLLAGGASYKQCAEYTGLSYVTIKRIGRSEGFLDYKSLVYNYGKSVKVLEKNSNDVIIDNNVTEDENIKLLRIICDKLDFIVKQLS